jgi:hypothetical protein
MTERSRLRKRPLDADAATIVRAADEIDIAGCASVAYSSEDPAHPVEHLFDGHSGPGARSWAGHRSAPGERQDHEERGHPPPQEHYFPPQRPIR